MVFSLFGQHALCSDVRFLYTSLPGVVQPPPSRHIKAYSIKSISSSEETLTTVSKLDLFHRVKNH